MDNNIKIIESNNFKTFSKLILLELKDNECVDQNFVFDQIEVEYNTTSLINAILYPLCDKDYGFVKTNTYSTKVILKTAVITVLITTVVLAIICFKMKMQHLNKVTGFNGAKASDPGFKNLVSEYVDETSIHGIRYIGQKQSHIAEK
jgi:hypothetical protein